MAFDLGTILKFLSPIGALGALGSHVYSKNRRFFEGTPEQEIKTPIYTPEQEEALNKLLEQSMQNLDISGIEDLARKRFQEETIPSLAERFTSMGAGGQSSSAFQSALGRAGSDLESRLASLRPQLGMQQLAYGSRPQFQTSFRGYSPGFLSGFAGPLGQSLPKILSILGGLI